MLKKAFKPPKGNNDGPKKRSLALTPESFETKMNIGLMTPEALLSVLSSKAKMPGVMSKILDLMEKEIANFEEAARQHKKTGSQRPGATYAAYSAYTTMEKAPNSKFSYSDLVMAAIRLTYRADLTPEDVNRTINLWGRRHDGATTWRYFYTKLENSLARCPSINTEVLRLEIPMAWKVIFNYETKRLTSKTPLDYSEDVPSLNSHNFYLNCLSNKNCPVDILELIEKEAETFQSWIAANNYNYNGLPDSVFRNILHNPNCPDAIVTKRCTHFPWIILGSKSAKPHHLQAIINGTNVTANTKAKALYKLFKAGHLRYSSKPSIKESVDVIDNE